MMCTEVIKAHRSNKEKNDMSLFERFVTEANDFLHFSFATMPVVAAPMVARTAGRRLSHCVSMMGGLGGSTRPHPPAEGSRRR